MAGIYFHIPFCKRICDYCDFYKSADLRRLGAVAEAMHRELDARRDYLRGEPLRTRYFGGGTPSLCPPELLGSLLEHTARLFDCSQVEETTLEANPDDLTPEYLAALRRLGIDRLSIGVQSFDDDCLRLLNRRHSTARAIEALRDARREGFDNLTIDLIFGIPGFGGDSLRRTLDTALETGVEHISAYHLTIESNTAFGRRMAQGRFAPVEEAVSEEEFLEVHLEFRPPGIPRPPQCRLLARRALPGHRTRGPLLRRRGAPLEPLVGGALHRRGRRRKRNPHRARPLQRICHDPVADCRRDRPSGGGRTVRDRTGRAHPGGGPAVGGARYGRNPRRKGVCPAPAHAALGCGHRDPFRNISGSATK